MHARADLAQYGRGLKTLRNFTVLRTGGVQSVPGTQYLGSTKSDGVARLAEAVFDDDEGYVLEFGNLYIRFWLAGALTTPGTTEAWSVSSIAYVAGEFVSHGGNIYICILANTSAATSEPGVGATWETYWYLEGASASAIIEWPTTYTLAELNELDIKVTALNTVTIAHASHETATLTRIANPNAAAEWTWTLADCDFASSSNEPAGLAVNGTSGTGLGYTVTRVVDGVESSAPAYVQTNITDTTPAALAVTLAAAPRTLSVTGTFAGARWRIYAKTSAGVSYLLYPESDRTVATVVDDGTGWLYTATPAAPPASPNAFAAANERPSVVGATQQRLLLAGSNNDPDVVNASVSADPYNFRVSNPIVDSDAMSWRHLFASGRLNRVRDIVEVAGNLVILSSAAETVAHGDGMVLRPGEVNPQVVSQNGSAQYPKALVADRSVLYVQARGGIVRDLSPDGAGSDLTMMAAHLVDGYTITDWCYQQTPNSTVWMVRSDGTLLALTYVQELGIVGWATRDTDGIFLSVACVTESGRDVVYAVVTRTINGSTKRYVERFYDRLAAIPIQLDCGKSATMTTGAVTGMSHLEGETVSVLKSDGTILASPNNTAYTAVTVSSGGFTIAGAGNATVYVGLPITSDLQTLDLDSAQVSRKDTGLNLKRVGIWLDASDTPFGGTTAPSSSTAVTTLQKVPRVDDDGNATTSDISGYREGALDGMWTTHGRVFLRHVDPTPLTILAIVPQGDFGGR